MLGIDPLVVVFGLGVGGLVGLTGIGGGSLMTPLLILVVGVQPVVAIGTDLAYGAVTKTVGGWRHLRKGTVDLNMSTWLAVGSLPGALLGVWAIDRLHHHFGKDLDSVLLACVAAALMVVSVATLGRALFMPKLIAKETEAADLTGSRKAWAVFIGFILGAILGLTSVGSGALIGLVLILVFRLTPHRVVGTDVFHAALLLWVAGFAHFVSGNVDFGLMANILIGSIPGVWIGTNLIGKLPADGLRPALGCVLLGSALGVATKAGAEIPVTAIVGLPVAVGALAYALHRRCTVGSLKKAGARQSAWETRGRSRSLPGCRDAGEGTPRTCRPAARASARDLQAWLKADAERGHARNTATPEDFGTTATAIRNDMSASIKRYGAHLHLQAIERTPTND